MAVRALPGRHAGRRALVTGAGSGIGRAIARRLAADGLVVLVADVRREPLTGTAEMIQCDGGQPLAVIADVRVADQVRRAVDDAVRTFGGLDLLGNAAGVVTMSSFDEVTEEEWDRVVGINLLGTFLCMTHEASQISKSEPLADGQRGVIINTAMISPGLSAYSATKFAVLGLSETLREELHPHGIGVTAICPGIINTPITGSTAGHGRAADPELRERLVKLYERRNYGPERVARNILKAVQRGRVVAPVSGEAWFSYGMKRTSPRLSGWVARKTNQFD